MAPHKRLSSTMRIDLTDDFDSGTDKPTTATHRMTQRIADATQRLVGGEDFQELFQSVYDAAIITRIDGTIVHGNSRAEQFFQREIDTLIGTDITNLISGSNAELMNTINASIKDDRFILIQAYCTRSDGSDFPAEVSVNQLHLSDSSYLNFFIRDVTHRKKAEEQLRTGHAAIQNSGSGIAVTDLDGKLQYFNPALAQLLALTDDSEASNFNIHGFLAKPKIAEQIEKNIVTGQPWSGELVMHCNDGSQIATQASVAPNLDADGYVVGMVWSLLDISDQKRIQLELQQHNAQLADDLSLANEFQQAFIQREYPTFPPGIPLSESAVELGHQYIPSGAVGGDFFEIFSVSLSRIGIFISDVMGHGVRSALIVATIRGLIEELGPFRYDPAAFLSHMNRDLSRIISHPGQTMFASAFYLVLDLTTGQMEWANAGHPTPIITSQNGTSERLESQDGITTEPALGLFPATNYHSHKMNLTPGEGLFLFTDGISEAENDEGDLFALDNLQASLKKHADCGTEELLEKLVADVRQFSGKDYFEDDVCLIAMKLRKLLNKTGIV